MDSPNALKSAARDLERSNRLPQALDLYTRIAEDSDDRTSGVAWRRVGEIAIRTDDKAKAIESFRAAASAFERAGQKNNALAMLQRIVDLAPEDFAGWQGIATVGAELQYLRDSREALGRVIRIRTESGDGVDVVPTVAAVLERFPQEAGMVLTWRAELTESGREPEAEVVFRELESRLSASASPAAAQALWAISGRSAGSSGPTVGAGGAHTSMPEVPRLDSVSAFGGGPPVADDLDLHRIVPLAGLEPTHLDEEESVDQAGPGPEEFLPLLDSADDLPLPGPESDHLDVAPRSEFHTPLDLPLLDLQRSDDEVLDEPSVGSELPLMGLSPLDQDFDQEGGDSEPLPLLNASPLPMEASEDPQDAIPLPELQSDFVNGFDMEVPFSEIEEEEPAPPALDVAAVVAGIRRIARRKIEAADADTHYDLGIAYKEMGSPEVALAQLAAALEMGRDPLSTLELVGEVLVERGDAAFAAELLQQADRLGSARGANLVAVHYWLGRALQSTGQIAEARARFAQAVEADPAFRDAAERMRA